MESENKINSSRFKLFFRGIRHVVIGALIGYPFGLIAGFFLNSLTAGMVFGIVCGALVGAAWRKQWPRWIRFSLIIIAFAAFVIVFIEPLKVIYQREMGLKIDKKYLIKDVRELAFVLETAHPDPYFHGGGKIAFHRRMQNLIRTIPPEGMTRTEFYELLCPFVAAVGDGHTSLRNPQPRVQASGGIPLRFQVVEKKFYVAGVTDSIYRNFIGSELISIEGLTVDELMQRQSLLRGCDNEYQVMRYIGYDGSLWFKDGIEQLIPEWQQKDSIRIKLLDPSGNRAMRTLGLNVNKINPYITPPSSVELPSTQRSNYVYKFLDSRKTTALLLIENMAAYRETFEMGISLGGERREGYAKELYKKYNGKPAPVNINEVINGIPSATDLFREMLREMKENKTENLIIDLRRNEGGNAFISTMFYYFLYGKEKLIEFSKSKSILIKKYSEYFWDQYPAWNIDEINKHQPIELTEDDYDFSGHPEPDHYFTREEAIRMIEDEAKLTSTFWQEYQAGEFGGYYRPKNIAILCTPLTTSSGYAFMYDHYTAGAIIVGTPSSQAGNNFGAWVGFKLRNSGLSGGVSHLYVTHFRDDPEMGRVFRPDYPLTYHKLKAYNFDPNADILFALEILESLK